MSDLERTWIEETVNKVDTDVVINGWISKARIHKNVIFWDVRDRTGIVQVVLTSDTAAFNQAAEIKEESAVSLTAQVNKRPDNLINQNLLTGTIELQAKSYELINESKLLPFPLDQNAQVNEDLRLKYRYLDLRSERMKSNLVLRHRVNQFLRNYLSDKGFLEIETPQMSKSTPEGARDFIIPARKYPGSFYALPQSPQQYKQLLMVAGIERYFQIARCFRDEDQRGERQPEFTQLDIEMSFVKEEDVINLVEEMMIALVKEVTPDKKFTSTPFLRLTHEESLQQYGTDAPDLRKDKSDPNELAFTWITNFPMFEYKEGDKRWGAEHNPFTMPYEKDHETIMKVAKQELDQSHLRQVRAHQYDLVLNGHEIFGGAVRNHDPKLLQAVFEALGHDSKEVTRQFGHMLEAFSYGVPPHAGIASGQDRLIMLLANEPTIREVIPFPKNGEGYDPLMASPAEVSTAQLKELRLKVINDQTKEQ